MTAKEYRDVTLKTNGRAARVRWTGRWWLLRRGALMTRHDSRAYALRLARRYIRGTP